MNLRRLLLTALAFSVTLDSAGAQRREVTLTVQGYEVSRATAAALAELKPAQLQASEVVRKLSVMATENKGAKIVRFGNPSGASGEKVQAVDEGGSFEAETVVSPDGLWVHLNISVKAATAKLTTAGAVPVGGFLLLGILEGRTEGNVTLIFVHAAST
jgi:hypothetical protein